MEIQQSTLYANFIRSLGWIVEIVDRSFVFIKPFPVIGGLAKIQRVTHLPSRSSLLPILKKYRIRSLAIEPDSRIKQRDFTLWCRRLSPHIRINRDPFIPTKTIRVNLTFSESDIFRRCTEAKRRAIRRAQKHNVTISINDDIRSFIHLKNQSAGFLGFITTTSVGKLWDTLPPANKSILLAYASSSKPSGNTNLSKPPIGETDKKIVGGIFLIFWKNIAYYWIAGATKQGKKLFAPTLLVWEAFRESKKQGCRFFDFVGVWDERRPQEHHEWKGFTKFKEGFGGEPLYYPIVS